MTLLMDMGKRQLQGEAGHRYEEASEKGAEDVMEHLDGVRFYK